MVSDDFEIQPQQEDIKSIAKSRLKDEVDQVSIGQSEDRIVYANRHAHSFLQQWDETREIMHRLLAENQTVLQRISTLSKKDSDKDDQLLNLGTRVALLAQSSEGYLAIRRRFLASYLRDHQNIQTTAGSRHIRVGNVAAVSGDALADAEVFSRDQRRDHRTYEELYGIDYNEVLKWQSAKCDECIFRVLNAHASFVAEGGTPSVELRQALESFVSRVGQFYPQSPKEDPQSPLGFAYYAFWQTFGMRAERRE